MSKVRKTFSYAYLILIRYIIYYAGASQYSNSNFYLQSRFNIASFITNILQTLVCYNNLLNNCYFKYCNVITIVSILLPTFFKATSPADVGRFMLLHNLIL